LNSGTRATLLNNANIEWRDNLPYSRDFNDIYFSRQDGLKETHYTFIEGNQLTERWKKLKSQTFTIAELGFGTGLNFLATAHHWHNIVQAHNKNSDRQKKWLHYYSIEKHPLTLADLTRALTNWPQFESSAEHLVQFYPLPIRGIWLIKFKSLRVQLFLIQDDFTSALEHFNSNRLTVDAWYLDGFAPAKNQSAWLDQIFSRISQSSRQASSIATFTAAGHVRRKLESVGFQISKRKGFGTKREMLVGTFIASDDTDTSKDLRAAKNNTLTSKSIAVIGAGIAGCTTARKLAECGHKVTLFDKANEVADAASGNSAGIYYPFLSSDFNSMSQFFCHAYAHTLHDFSYYKLTHLVKPIGMIKLEHNDEKLESLLKQFNNNTEFERWFEKVKASDIRSIDNSRVAQYALHYPRSGYCNPKLICQALVSDSDINLNIEVKLNTHVTQLEQYSESWHVTYRDTSNQAKVYTNAQFDTVVLCNSFAAKGLIDNEFLLGIPVRGQTTKVSKAVDRQKADPGHSKVICEDIYLVPMHDEKNQHIGDFVGATFERNNTELSASIASQQWLNQKYQTLTGRDVKNDQLNGRVGIRFCSVDRFPIVGAVPDLKQYLEHYRELWKGKPISNTNKSLAQKNLYVNIGHGARGITTSFLAASLIEHLIDDKPSPLFEDLAKLVRPNRFILRELKKSQDRRLPGFVSVEGKLTD
jgi:tRNA 5-methylaminomethyl-2-thiouridine biosynthesis bifunctional protein